MNKLITSILFIATALSLYAPPPPPPPTDSGGVSVMVVPPSPTGLDTVTDTERLIVSLTYTVVNAGDYTGFGTVISGGPINAMSPGDTFAATSEGPLTAGLEVTTPRTADRLTNPAFHGFYEANPVNASKLVGGPVPACVLGVINLDDLGDVTAAAPCNGDGIFFNSCTGDWEATAVVADGNGIYSGSGTLPCSPNINVTWIGCNVMTFDLDGAGNCVGGELQIRGGGCNALLWGNPISAPACGEVLTFNCGDFDWLPSAAPTGTANRLSFYNACGNLAPSSISVTACPLFGFSLTDPCASGFYAEFYAGQAGTPCNTCQTYWLIAGSGPCTSQARLYVDGSACADVAIRASASNVTIKATDAGGCTVLGGGNNVLLGGGACRTATVSSETINLNWSGACNAATINVGDSNDNVNIGGACSTITIGGAAYPPPDNCTSLYTADGALSAARTVTLGANDLTFSGASGCGTDFVVDLSCGTGGLIDLTAGNGDTLVIGSSIIGTTAATDITFNAGTVCGNNNFLINASNVTIGPCGITAGFTETDPVFVCSPAFNTTGANTGDQTITLTGDVTGSGTGSFAATIANNSVSNAKAADMTGFSVKAKPTTGSGNPTNLVIGANTVLGRAAGNVVAAQLVEAQMADNAVTLAKMAGGTDGNLITFDSSGDPAYVATGCSGNILISNGAGAAPTFQDLRNEGVVKINGDCGSSGFTTLSLCAGVSGQLVLNGCLNYSTSTCWPENIGCPTDADIYNAEVFAACDTLTLCTNYEVLFAGCYTTWGGGCLGVGCQFIATCGTNPLTGCLSVQHNKFLENAVDKQVHMWRITTDYDRAAPFAASEALMFKLRNPISGFETTDSGIMVGGEETGRLTFIAVTIADNFSIGNGYELYFEGTVDVDLDPVSVTRISHKKD